jgi:hypothetical protein
MQQQQQRWEWKLDTKGMTKYSFPEYVMEVGLPEVVLALPLRVVSSLDCTVVNHIVTRPCYRESTSY